jgi:hypothetical protein
MKPALFAISFLCGVFTSAASGSAASQVVYQQGGHKCVLDYDSNVFKAGSIQQDNYRRFSGTNPDTYFRVTAASNEENISPEKIREEFILKRGKKDLVYDRTKDQFLVLSGYRGANIFYTKIALSADNKTICVLDIFYPRQLRRSFDEEVTRMSLSFAALN